VLVVNVLDRVIHAEVDGQAFGLGPYGVRWLRR
jgi:hypothetical protein